MAPNAFPENAEQNGPGSSGFVCETETFRRFLDSRIPIPGRVIPFFIGIHKSSFRSHFILSFFKTIPAFPPPKSQSQTPSHLHCHTAPLPGFILHPNHFPSAVTTQTSQPQTLRPESLRQNRPAKPIRLRSPRPFPESHGILQPHFLSCPANPKPIAHQNCIRQNRPPVQTATGSPPPLLRQTEAIPIYRPPRHTGNRRTTNPAPGPAGLTAGRRSTPPLPR